MTDYSRTIEAVRAASQDLADETWQGDDQTPGRDIRAGRAVGNVRVYPHPERGATVTIELDGLTAEQAIAVLRALSPGYRVTNEPPMNTEGWDAPPEGGVSPPTRARATYEQQVGRLKRRITYDIPVLTPDGRRYAR